MTLCYKCKCELDGDWKFSKAANPRVIDSGRFLGLNAFFLSTFKPKWVYCYCEKCFRENVCFGDDLKEKDATIQQLTDERDRLIKEKENHHNPVTNLSQERETLNKKLALFEANVKQLTIEKENLILECDTFNKTIIPLKQELENMKTKWEMQQRQLLEQEHIYHRAKNNIYSLPEVCELIKMLNEIPKEDVGVLSESGFDCDIIKIVEEKQRSMTLDVVASFKRDISTQIESQVTKINDSIKLLKDYLSGLEQTLHGESLLSVRQGITSLTKKRIEELDNDAMKWSDYRPKFSSAKKSE